MLIADHEAIEVHLVLGGVIPKLSCQASEYNTIIWLVPRLDSGIYDDGVCGARGGLQASCQGGKVFGKAS
jgi:hypothetical protein